MFPILLFLLMLSSALSENCDVIPKWLREVKNCCDRPRIVPVPATKECMKFFHLDERPTPIDHRPTHWDLNNCYFHCELTKAKFIQNGNVDLRLVSISLNQTMATRPEETKNAIEGVRFCADVAAKSYSEIQSTVDTSRINGVSICDPYANYLMKCILANRLATCTDKFYNFENERCVLMRKHFQKCPIPKI